MASPTVTIFSASSSGISSSNSSSNAITSSTVSSESAPRSSMNFAFGLTSSSSTPSCSQMISLTRSSTGFAMDPSPLPQEDSRGRSHVEPAVDVEDLPGHVRGPVAGQESYHLRDLGGRAAPPERHLGQQRRARLGGKAGRHVRVDQS